MTTASTPWEHAWASEATRVPGIVHELNNESIDVVTWTTNPVLFNQRDLRSLQR